MEDIFDSLIYIIIVIVGFVISALGKKRKKSAQRVIPNKQSQPTQPAQSSQPTQQKERPFLSNLEQLLNEELGIAEDKYEDVYEEEIPKKEAEPILDSPFSTLDTTESILDSIPVESRSNEDVPFSIEYEDNNEILKNPIKAGEIMDEEESEVLKNFDLKEAIIYSEIINRKEY